MAKRKKSRIVRTDELAKRLCSGRPESETQGVVLDSFDGAGGVIGLSRS